MRPTTVVPAVFAALVIVLTLSASAGAQSVIAGVVRDTSGAVLPGVTFADQERWWMETASRSPRSTVTTALATCLPGALASALALDPLLNALAFTVALLVSVTAPVYRVDD